MRVLRRILPVVCLLAAGLILRPAVFAAANGPAPAADARVREALARDGSADVLIVLGTPPDLSPAERLPGKEARGRWVYDTLRQEAARSQAPVIAELERAGAAYRRFWVVNAVQARVNAALLSRLLALPGVTHVASNAPFRGLDPAEARPSAASTGAAAGIEWGVSRVNAPWAWSQGYTGQGVVISGQDTGYSWTHPALMAAYRGYNPATGIADHNYNWHDSIHGDIGVPNSNPCGYNSPAPCDDQGHGTHTMGTLAGNDLAAGAPGWPAAAANAVGVAPGARWIGCRNMDVGDGTPATYIECFEWLIAPYAIGGDPGHGDPARAPDVMNNSWGCTGSEGCTADNLAVIEPALDAADAAGILVVVSAGNSGSACQTIWNPPAIYPRAFAVGNTANGDALASNSSRGPVTYNGQTAIKPDLSAPGSNVRSSYWGWDSGTGTYTNTYRSLSGTSMAAPHVAGVAALLISAQPSLRGQTGLLRAILARTAEPKTYAACGGAPGGVPNNGYGWGIVDARRAIQSLGQAGTLSGAVTDAGTGLGLAGASVTLYALGSSLPLTATVTDDGGRYSVPAAWGSYRVAAAAPGYAPAAASPVYVVGGQATRQDIACSPQPAPSPTATATATATGTATETPTETPAATVTPTASQTPTASRTPTPTASPPTAPLRFYLPLIRADGWAAAG